MTGSRLPPSRVAIARSLAEDGLAWLRATYPDHGFVVERDVVWTLQKWLAAEAVARSTGLVVLNDYGVEKGQYRSLSADIAIATAIGALPEYILEFKYEPSHHRPDSDPRKFPVVGWEGVTKDIERIRRWVGEGLAGGGRSVFIDEGSFSEPRHPVVAGCVWERWGTYGTTAMDVRVLMSSTG